MKTPNPSLWQVAAVNVDGLVTTRSDPHAVIKAVSNANENICDKAKVIASLHVDTFIKIIGADPIKRKKLSAAS